LKFTELLHLINWSIVQLAQPTTAATAHASQCLPHSNMGNSPVTKFIHGENIASISLCF